MSRFEEGGREMKVYVWALVAKDSNREGFRELKGVVLIMCPWTEGSEL